MRREVALQAIRAYKYNAEYGQLGGKEVRVDKAPRGQLDGMEHEESLPKRQEDITVQALLGKLAMSLEYISNCCTHRQEAIRVFTIPTQQQGLTPDETTSH